MTFLNQIGLKNDYVFLGFKGGFELRDPRDLSRSVLQAKHHSIRDVRHVEFRELHTNVRDETTWYMAILCGYYDKKEECEKYQFHQYKMVTYFDLSKDSYGKTKKIKNLKIKDETH